MSYPLFKNFQFYPCTNPTTTLIFFLIALFLVTENSLGQNNNKAYEQYLIDYQKNKNVESIMLEINRKLYLKKGTNEKSENYEKTKKVVQEYIYLIKNEL